MAVPFAITTAPSRASFAEPATGLRFHQIMDDYYKPAQRMKAYVHINEPQAPHYRETAHAMSQKKTRDIVLQRAWSELQAWRKRYADLKEFAALIEVIDDTAKLLPNASKAH